MPTLAAWHLSLAIRHWHAVLDGALALLVVAVLFFRWPTVVEVLLVLALVAHHVPAAVKGIVDRLLTLAGFPAREDD